MKTKLFFAFCLGFGIFCFIYSECDKIFHPKVHCEKQFCPSITSIDCKSISEDVETSNVDHWLRDNPDGSILISGSCGDKK